MSEIGKYFQTRSEPRVNEDRHGLRGNEDIATEGERKGKNRGEAKRTETTLSEVKQMRRQTSPDGWEFLHPTLESRIPIQAAATGIPWSKSGEQVDPSGFAHQCMCLC